MMHVQSTGSRQITFDQSPDSARSKLELRLHSITREFNQGARVIRVRGVVLLPGIAHLGISYDA